MLPGFRFIFATVILSASFLIFGLGAAALLRVSHEEFAALPPWRVAQPQFPPAPVEMPPPTLAMLRIETPEVAKTEVTGDSPDPKPATSADPDAQGTPDESNVTAETPSQPALEPSAEKSAEGSQREPIPMDAPAPTAIATAPTPAIEKQENGTMGGVACGLRNSEAEAPAEAHADQSEAAVAKTDKVEAADVKVAAITPREMETSESKASDPSVIIATTPETKRHEVKLRTIKVHAARSSKPVAKKAKRSGIYAMARRKRAAARARAIARARAARIAAQQKLVAMDPLAALFGIQTQPTQVMQTPQQ